MKVALAMIMDILSTVFATKAGFAIGRSAVFLVLFLFIHLAGNLSLFVGATAFNEYTLMLNTGVIGMAIKVC